MTRILVAESPPAAAQNAAEIFIAAAREALRARGRFIVALSGGSTPRALYERLAAPTFDPSARWERVYLLFGDERCVPPGDMRSNYGLVERTGLLRRRLGGVLRIRGELGCDAAADLASKELRALAREIAGPEVGSDAHTGAPRLDLALLGIGSDGHTASLFPGSKALEEGARPAMPAHGPDGVDRVTLTVPVFAAARRLLFLATGRDKAQAVAVVLATAFAADGFPGAATDVPAGASGAAFADANAGSALVSPAALVARAAEKRGCMVEWLLDREAASALEAF